MNEVWLILYPLSICALYNLFLSFSLVGRKQSQFRKKDPLTFVFKANLHCIMIDVPFPISCELIIECQSRLLPNTVRVACCA